MTMPRFRTAGLIFDLFANGSLRVATVYRQKLLARDGGYEPGRECESDFSELAPAEVERLRKFLNDEKTERDYQTAITLSKGCWKRC